MSTQSKLHIPQEAIVVYIVGPTASGKTSLAIDLAWAPRSQIVCLDKRTVVSGMDIGTAKPTVFERRRATHRMIGQVSAADPQLSDDALRHMATKIINDLLESDIAIPYIVSGSVSFVEDMVYGSIFKPVDSAFLASLTVRSLPQLLTLCKEQGYDKPFLLEPPVTGIPGAQVVDKQRTIRHILRQKYAEFVRTSPLRGTLVLGVNKSETALDTAIETRTSAMFEQGLAAEVESLLKSTNGQWTDYLKNTIGYREFYPYLRGRSDLDKVKQNIVTNTRRYAHWQQAAFTRRIPDIQWVKDAHEAETTIKKHIIKAVSGDDYLAWLYQQKWSEFLGVNFLSPAQVRRRVIECYAYHMEKAKAVIFDIDGTLSQEMSWLSLTRDLGASVDAEKQIFSDYKAGNINYETAKNQVLDLWKKTGNANKETFQRIFEGWPLDPYAERLITLARRDNRAICLITGSMDLYAQTIAKRLGVSQWYANTTLHWDQKGNLVDMDYELNQAARKIEQFSEFCRKRGIQPHECIVVGDDEIDLGLFAASRRGVLVGADQPQEHVQQAWKTASTLADVEVILDEF